MSSAIDCWCLVRAISATSDGSRWRISDSCEAMPSVARRALRSMGLSCSTAASSSWSLPKRAPF
eukprot:6359983-Alexandrium_andersonii.AAC.1